VNFRPLDFAHWVIVYFGQIFVNWKSSQQCFFQDEGYALFLKKMDWATFWAFFLNLSGHSQATILLCNCFELMRKSSSGHFRSFANPPIFVYSIALAVTAAAFGSVDRRFESSQSEILLLEFVSAKLLNVKCKK
jgi:hypothetical protein